MKIFVVELPLKRNEQILRRVQEVVNGLLVELRRDHAQVLDDGAESKPDFGHVANFNFGVESHHAESLCRAREQNLMLLHKSSRFYDARSVF